MDTDVPLTTETKAAGTAARETQPTASDAHGKLQVVISDEGFEAGRLNTVSIVVLNPFDVPVEILGIEAPRSSHQRPVRGRSWNEITHALFSSISYVAPGAVSLGGMSVKFSERTEGRFVLHAQESPDSGDRSLAG